MPRTLRHALFAALLPMAALSGCAAPGGPVVAEAQALAGKPPPLPPGTLPGAPFPADPSTRMPERLAGFQRLPIPAELRPPALRPGALVAAYASPEGLSAVVMVLPGAVPAGGDARDRALTEAARLLEDANTRPGQRDLIGRFALRSGRLLLQCHDTRPAPSASGAGYRQTCLTAQGDRVVMIDLAGEPPGSEASGPRRPVSDRTAALALALRDWLGSAPPPAIEERPAPPRREPSRPAAPVFRT